MWPQYAAQFVEVSDSALVPRSAQPETHYLSTRISIISLFSQV